MNKIFITGSSGFIGFHLARRFLRDGWEVMGFDSMNEYYDVKLKEDRNNILLSETNYYFKKGLLEESDKLEKTITDFKPNKVIHLAAQAGVRYSLSNPEAYVQSNLIGFSNLLEVVKKIKCDHFLMASTSSVYGGNTKMPYREIHSTDFPMSFYAATKKANEVMAHSYSHLHSLPITCFRFFTVYGPWGRPDMALFKFTEAILNNKQIDIYNYGKMERDFTFIDDLIEAICRLTSVPPVTRKEKRSAYETDSLSNIAPWRVVNIGNNKPVKLMDFVTALEKELGKKADKNFTDIQAGDVPKTYADIKLLKELTGFEPQTSIDKGIQKFVEWYMQYYRS